MRYPPGNDLNLGLLPRRTVSLQFPWTIPAKQNRTGSCHDS